MMFQGALLREQGVTFAIVIVKMYVVQNNASGNDTIRSFQPAFPGVPLVLMAQDCRDVPTYFGRHDIVRFLSNVPVECIPWKQFTIS